MHALADADWAGDRQPIKSVRSMILHGKHLIKARMKKQSPKRNCTLATAPPLNRRGVEAFAKDLGRAVPIRLHVDSSAALSFTRRTSLENNVHRDPALVAPGGGPQPHTDGGKDSFRNKLVQLGHEASH